MWGGILGTTKYFRNNFNLYENESFGKFYQELQTSVGKEFFVNTLKFTEDDFKKGSVCTAKSSFRINKSIGFSKLIEISKSCEEILDRPSIVSINDVSKLTKQKNEDLIKSLYTQLSKQLYDTFTGAEDSIPFDLCHKDYETYLTASCHQVKCYSSKKPDKDSKIVRGLINYLGVHEFDKLTNIDDIFTLMREQGKTFKSQEQFWNKVKSLRISCMDSDGVEILGDDFLSFLMGNIKSENGDEYFYVDKTWYEIKSTFVKNLNEACSSFIKDNLYAEVLKEWDAEKHNENQYNAQYIAENGTIVLDKITPDNIELCDILKWDDKNAYLIHVKSGFGNTMRDLCAQISIAANKLSQDLKGDNKKAFIKEIYKDLFSKKDLGGITAR